MLNKPPGYEEDPAIGYQNNDEGNVEWYSEWVDDISELIAKITL